eukprot:scaffold3731_cov381-Prasinococcus_capsulatus_cf.AAC.10
MWLCTPRLSPPKSVCSSVHQGWRSSRSHCNRPSPRNVRRLASLPDKRCPRKEDPALASAPRSQPRPVHVLGLAAGRAALPLASP